MIIEFVSTFIVRPFSLMVRLFANMLAGHLILVTFAVICTAALLAAKITVVIVPFSFALLVAMTGFEILVELPAGVHLHDPDRGVHRQLHAPRALTHNLAQEKNKENPRGSAPSPPRPGGCRPHQGV